MSGEVYACRWGDLPVSGGLYVCRGGLRSSGGLYAYRGGAYACRGSLTRTLRRAEEGAAGAVGGGSEGDLRREREDGRSGKGG